MSNKQLLRTNNWLVEMMLNVCSFDAGPSTAQSLFYIMPAEMTSKLLAAVEMPSFLLIVSNYCVQFTATSNFDVNCTYSCKFDIILMCVGIFDVYITDKLRMGEHSD